MPSRKRTKRITAVAAAVVIVAVAAAACVLLMQRAAYLRDLRAQMGEGIAGTIVLMDAGNYPNALASARAARETAALLSDNDALSEIDLYIRFINAAARADEHYREESYQSALNAYKTASMYAQQAGISTRYIDKKAASAEAEVAEQIALAIWRAESLRKADSLVEQGNLLFLSEEYDSAIEEYKNAVEIYLELDEIISRLETEARIDSVLHSKAEKEAEAARLQAEADSSSGDSPGEDGTGENPPVGDAPGTDGTDSTGDGNRESVYDYNRSIDFDLSVIINDQNNEPASLVIMGTADGRNEGWYNGCGWIAAYNVSVKLGDPRHPADIVSFFEASGGTVMDGVFGTYPDAIEDYFLSLGYRVKHTFFPQTRLGIDDEIKAAGLGILAYAHTSAAHYAAIEYRESDGRFIVYNDSLARARSRELNLSDPLASGAVIDSVESWLTQTPEILFAFSLITVSS